MTTKLEQAAQNLLNYWDSDEDGLIQNYITALREALAEQAEQEPLMITPGGGAFPFAVVGELEQAEQEPVAYDWDTIHQVLCEVWNRDSSADEGLEAIQDLIYSESTIEAKEPVARVPAHPEQGLEWLQPPPVWGTLLYAAPVRTKDLTDDEIWDATNKCSNRLDFARAAIAADREKNNV